MNMDRAYYLREKISRLRGFQVDLEVPIFNEFAVRSDKPFGHIQKQLMARQIFPGIDLSKWYPEKKNQFLVCATETKTKDHLDRLVEALSQC